MYKAVAPDADIDESTEFGDALDRALDLLADAEHSHHSAIGVTAIKLSGRLGS